MSWVIKHTDYHPGKYIKMTRRGPTWSGLDDATHYPSEADAQIEIKRYGIPYCKAKELSKRDR